MDPNTKLIVFQIIFWLIRGFLIIIPLHFIVKSKPKKPKFKENFVYFVHISIFCIFIGWIMATTVWEKQFVSLFDAFFGFEQIFILN